MSKRFTFLLLPVCLALPLPAQDRYDYTWLLGYPPSWPAQKYGGSLLRFSDNEAVRVSYSDIGLDLTLIGEICDQKGKLQFYANGCAIFNAQHAQMENGDSLNYPYFTRYEWQTHNCFQGFEYPKLYNGLLTLPLPGSDHEYVLFHLRHDKVPDPANHPLDATQSLLYSQIDMSANNGLGRVTKKNVLILKDTFCDHLAAVRHGNGRDWWLVAQKATGDSAFLFLLGPDGPKGPFPQKIGVDWPSALPFYMGWQAVFSQKGDLYARVNWLNGIHLYRFDRCGGVFFDPQIIPFPDTAVFAPGLAFSPNGRWLYFGTGDKLFQYDCRAKDIAASKTLIAVYDGFTTPIGLATYFHQMRLAPDGKIYMSAANSVEYLHIIHNPDGRASHCNFEQHGLELPTYNGFCLPNFPNFRLYGLEGGPCDTLMSVATQMARLEQNGLTPFPNPADQWVTVRLPAPLASSGRLLVHSSTGALVHETMLSPDDGPPSFDVSAWPSGLYLITHEASWRRAQSTKLVVWHAAD